MNMKSVNKVIKQLEHTNLIIVSCDLQLCFMLALFHDKKYCNCNKLFPCILWNFIILDLVLSWWKIKHAMKIIAISRLACKKLASKRTCEKATWEAHVGSWRVKCQAVFCKYFMRKAVLRGTHETLCLEDFKCNFLILHPYYIYFHYPQN